MVRSKEQLEKMFAKSREEHTKKKIKPKVKKKNAVKPKKEEFYYLDKWKNDKEFLNEKLDFYNSKKRKRPIDRIIAKILYHVLNGTEQELIDNYGKNTLFEEIFGKPQNIEEIYYPEICYIKTIYNDFLTKKYTKEILNNLKI